MTTRWSAGDGDLPGLRFERMPITLCPAGQSVAPGELHSRRAGVRIETIDDLVDAIRRGQLDANEILIEFVIRDGEAFINDTRTARALTEAGVPVDR